MYINKYTSIQGRCVEDGKVELAICSPPPFTQTQKHTWSVYMLTAAWAIGVRQTQTGPTV